ncbi:TlpA family protein disulfide reductase [Acidobacteriota bacterium]
MIGTSKSRCLARVIFFLYLLCAMTSPAESNGEETIRIPMTFKEQKGLTGFGLNFDESAVKKALAEHPIMEDFQLGENDKLGLTFNKVFVLIQKNLENKTIRLIVDTDRNDSFSDESPIFLKSGDTATIKILRHYSNDRKVWLPYNISYTAREDGDSFFYSSGYVVQGQFTYKNVLYSIRLSDMSCNGKFNDDASRGTNLSIDMNHDGQFRNRNEYYHSTELLPLGGDFFEISEIEEDGSLITLKSSDLKHVKIGDPAPDYDLKDSEGNTIKFEELKGSVVILNFWASWCKPCIAKFPYLKELNEKFKESSVKFIGINWDLPDRIKNARALIEQFQFSWPQVFMGDAERSPFWKMYSRVREHASYWSTIVVLDKKGFIRYSTSFSDDLKPIETLIEDLNRQPITIGRHKNVVEIQKDLQTGLYYLIQPSSLNSGKPPLITAQTRNRTTLIR